MRHWMLQELVSMRPSQLDGRNHDLGSCLTDGYCLAEKAPHLVRSSICTTPPLPRQSSLPKSISEITALLTVSVILYKP